MTKGQGDRCVRKPGLDKSEEVLVDSVSAVHSAVLKTICHVPITSLTPYQTLTVSLTCTTRWMECAFCFGWGLTGHRVRDTGK